jgi:hypothetical protein
MQKFLRYFFPGLKRSRICCFAKIHVAILVVLCGQKDDRTDSHDEDNIRISESEFPSTPKNTSADGSRTPNNAQFFNINQFHGAKPVE